MTQEEVKLLGQHVRRIYHMYDFKDWEGLQIELDEQLAGTNDMYLLAFSAMENIPVTGLDRVIPRCIEICEERGELDKVAFLKTLK